nr:52 kDa repressor of the inhibitor of the protein kinase [Drosophila kikkawai]
MRCAVNNCGNNNRHSNKSKWRFFHFPREPTLLKKWVDFCERDNINPETACICNEHFVAEDFERNMQYELGFTRKNPTKLRPGSYPTCKGPRKLSNKITKGSINNSFRVKQDPIKNPSSPQHIKHSPFQDAVEEAVEECEILSDLLEDFEHSSRESGGSYNTNDNMHLEVQNIDPHYTQTMVNDDVETIASKDDTYVKYLEEEV